MSLALSPEDIDDIENGYDFDPGFPHNFISLNGKAPQGPEDVHLLQELGQFDYVGIPKAIQPHQVPLTTTIDGLSNGVHKLDVESS